MIFRWFNMYSQAPISRCSYYSPSPPSCNSSPKKAGNKGGSFLPSLKITFAPFQPCFWKKWEIPMSFSHKIPLVSFRRKHFLSGFCMGPGLVSYRSLQKKSAIAPWLCGRILLASDKLSSGVSISALHFLAHNRSCDGWSWKSGKDLTWKIEQLSRHSFPARTVTSIFQHQPP